MPLIYSEKEKRFGKLVLWKMKEDLDFFKSQISLSESQAEGIKQWQPNRQKEWCAARFLLNEYFGITLDDTETDSLGKVHLVDKEDHISISHSDQLVGVQYNKRPVGVDIQIQTEKIQRIASRFCADCDYEIMSKFYGKEESELYLWSLKESVYKAYGQGNVSYRDEIRAVRFINDNRHRILLKLTRNTEPDQYYLGRLRMLGNYCLTQVIESQD